MEKISEFTVRRLSSYFRILNDLKQKGEKTVSSARLAALGGVTPAQVRKDLSYFGSFGTRGLGYDVEDLREEIKTILGLDRKWTMALFGAGSLGHALFFFQGFREDGFTFTHIFDVDKRKIGRKWEGVEIKPLSQAKRVLKKKPVDIGVIATPKEGAQEIVDILVDLGIRGILNFAPRELSVPGNVKPRNVNLAVALESLSFFLSS
jgi:redox-sensing transcriptional repressor